MDYLHQAFGAFEPQRDRNAALKFSLNVLLMDGRLEDLQGLVTAGSRVSGVGGEPGWEIDRIEAGGLQYRAQVDPDSFALAHPEVRCDAAAFWAVLRPLLSAYLEHRPQDAAAVKLIVAKAPAEHGVA